MAKRNDNDNLISNPDILFTYSVDMLVVMIALLIAGFYLNGFNAIRTAFWAVIPAVLSEDIACRITKRTDKRAHNLFAAATGLAIALMLPATVPSYIAAAASLFAVIAVLIPFGSARRIPFVPAAAGIAFVTVCFREAVFTYSPVHIGVSSPVFGTEGFIAQESFTKMLTYGKSVILNPIETISVLMGQIPGPMGTTCVLVLIGAAIYLVLKRKSAMLTSAAFFAACALYAVIFPRVSSGAYHSVVMELSSGMLIFAGLVLLPEPFTTPKNISGGIIYGAVAGIICMLLRNYGAYEESVCFTVLIMNALAPAVSDYFDIIVASLREKGIIKEKKKKFAENNLEEEKKKRERREKKQKEKSEQLRKEKAAREEMEKQAAKAKKEKKHRQPRQKPAAVSKKKKEEKSVREKLPHSDDILSYDEIMKFDDDADVQNEAAEKKDEVTDDET